MSQEVRSKDEIMEEIFKRDYESRKVSMRYILFDGISQGKVAVERIHIWGMEEVQVNGEPCTTLLTNAAKITVAHSLTDILDKIANYDEAQFLKQKEEWAERSRAQNKAKEEWKQAEKEVGLGKAQSKRTETVDGKTVVTLTYEKSKDDENKPSD